MKKIKLIVALFAFTLTLITLATATFAWVNNLSKINQVVVPVGSTTELNVALSA